MICDREVTKALHLVTPEFDSNGVFFRGGEYVDDPTAHGHLAAALHQVDALVAEVDQPIDHVGEHDRIAHSQTDGRRVGHRTNHGLDDRTNGRHHDVDRLQERIGVIGSHESTQDRRPPADRVRRRR